MKRRLELTEGEVKKIIAMWAEANSAEVEIEHISQEDEAPTIRAIVEQRHINILEDNQYAQRTL